MTSGDKYSYQRFGSNAQRVGQAALDIISKDQPVYTTEDILDEFGKDYLADIQKFADEEKNKFDGIFYIFSLLHKDLGQFGVGNVLRHWKISRQTAPEPKSMMEQYKNHTKTLYEVNPQKGEITLLWSLPGFEECISILKNPDLYDRDLIKWIRGAIKPKELKLLYSS